MIIKNSNLRRNFFENRYKILAIIVAIILVLCLIRALNEIVKNMNKNTAINSNTTQSSYQPQETLILGDNISTKVQEKSNKIMDEFIQLCNEKQIEKAYNLLTDECKEEIFGSNIEYFKNHYIEKIFTNYKTYNMQSWINGRNPTYKVRILDDVLSTGKTGDVVEEYYTIVKQNDGYKLNINSYIGRTGINKQITENDITIHVLSKDTYMDYEIYNIQVRNNSNNTILLDAKTNQKTVYLTANNEATYRAFMYEIDDVFLKIRPRLYSNLSIKFNKIYSPNVGIYSMTFTDIVLNLDEYENLANKEEYTNKVTMQIDL